MPQNRFRSVVEAQGTGRKAKTEQIGDEQLKAIGQEGSQAPVFEKTAVETMQQQQRRALAEHRHREGIIHTQARQRSTTAPERLGTRPAGQAEPAAIDPEASSKAAGAEFGSTHKGLQQSTRRHSEGQMMQIGTLTAGEATHLLQLTEAGLRQTQIIKADGQTKLPQQRQQLAVRLACKPVAAQTFLQAKLHKDSEAHLLAMENVVAGLQLGKAVVNGVGRNSAATGAAQSPHHPGGESTGFGGAHPGSTVWILQRCGLSISN